MYGLVKRILFVMSVFAMLLISNMVMAASLDVSWARPFENCDGSAYNDHGGYTVHWGPSPRVMILTGMCGSDPWQYPNQLTIGGDQTAVSIDIGDSDVERVVFIAVTVEDLSGNRSLYSEELVKIVPPTVIPDPNPGTVTTFTVVVVP